MKRRVVWGLAALVLVCTGAGAVALHIGRAGDSSGRLVAALGDTASSSATSATSIPSITAGNNGGSGPGDTTSPGVTAVVVTPKVTTRVLPPSTLPGGPVATTVPAPVTSTPTTIAPTGSGVRGTVLFSPTCPVEQIPPNPACAPRPGPAHIELVRIDGTTAAQGDAVSDGHFAISVAPGTYTVAAQAASTSGSPGRGCTVTPAQVIVNLGAGTTLAVSCDTGIR